MAKKSGFFASIAEKLFGKKKTPKKAGPKKGPVKKKATKPVAKKKPVVGKKR